MIPVGCITITVPKLQERYCNFGTVVQATALPGGVRRNDDDDDDNNNNNNNNGLQRWKCRERFESKIQQFL